MKKVFVAGGFEVELTKKSLKRFFASKAVVVENFAEADVIVTGSPVEAEGFAKNTEAKILILGYKYEDLAAVCKVKKYFPGRVFMQNSGEDCTSLLKELVEQ